MQPPTEAAPLNRHPATRLATLPCLPTCLPACRSATSSMTSVPKPLKFLRPHYNTLRDELEGLPAGAANRQPLADVVRGEHDSLGPRPQPQLQPANNKIACPLACCLMLLAKAHLTNR